MQAKQKNIRPYHARMKAILWIFGLLSLLVVPALTLYLGAFGDPFRDSFSHIGNLGGQRATFLIWTLVLCAYFSATVHTLVVLTKCSKAKPLRWMVLISTWLLLITNLLPFFPDRFPFLADLHSVIAMVSTLLLTVTLLLLTLTLKKGYPRIYRMAMAGMIGMIMIMIVLFSIFIAKWITEATCIISGGIYLFFLMLWIYKENDFNADDVLGSYDIQTAKEEVRRLEERREEAYKAYLKATDTVRRAQTELDELVRRRKHEPV